MLCLRSVLVFFSRLLGLLAFLWVFDSSLAVASSSLVTGHIKTVYDCADAMTAVGARRAAALDDASRWNCSVTEDTGVKCWALGTGYYDAPEGECGVKGFHVQMVRTDAPSSDPNCSLSGRDEQGNWIPQGDEFKQACLGSNTVECPTGSAPTSPGDPSDFTCTCSNGSLSYDGLTCEAVKPDPCPPIMAACESGCGAAGADINQCNSTDGDLVGTPYCHCKETPPDDPTAKCNPETGAGCSTSGKQDEQTGLLSGIQSNTSGVKESVDGVKTSVDGLKGSITGQLGQTNTLLGQILNSDGVKNAGGGGGGDVNVDTGGIESRLDSINNKMTPGADTGKFAKTVTPYDNTAYDNANNLKVKELQDQMDALRVQMKADLTNILHPPAVSGSAHLPCWRNLPLYQSHTFNICFADYEEQLSIIPLFVYGLGFLIAGLIILGGKK
ncbi:MAG: hypothetical protein PHE17_07335 [Thiothrix sp.]|uniref:hypothetical protein n=1 Tax=Thiothrix sp. TaxID=1032 RepID=UPI00260F58CB|nr:hypothetical protein [Thiothrix sp.]MDD5392817.1 hypothetical protein [Thiothrix sp.]